MSLNNQNIFTNHVNIFFVKEAYLVLTADRLSHYLCIRLEYQSDGVQVHGINQGSPQGICRKFSCYSGPTVTHTLDRFGLLPIFNILLSLSQLLVRSKEG